MNWNQYYQKPLTLADIVGNFYGQQDFLVEIYNTNAQKILEVGTGSGAMSIFFSWLGRDVTGIDLDPEVIAKAKVEATRFNGRVNFQVADTFQLPFADNSFDLIFHQGLLEHFSDDEIRRMVAEQLRVAPRVIVSMPNHWYPTRDYGNERLMDKARWEAIFAPFKIEKSYYYSPKRFPRPWLWRKPIQYLAVLTRADN